ncbi:MAG: formylglycine-generating enzyme family protein [Akkermansiaceae bacterium]|nr:formylglycine-generating enzyme family protein [Akkermansiaceae bacterium]
MRTTRPGPAPLPLPAAITVPAGEYLTLESTTAALGSFQISANETTIGQYAEFLAVLKKSANPTSYDLPDQPPEKTSHVPDEWAALLAAADKNGNWNGQTVTLDSPVVGIDWWDASAYAAWKGARLPTQDEWFAAYHHGAAELPIIPPGNYLPVTRQKVDRTPEGLLGMAGSVSEWIGRTVPNPSNPLGEQVWVIIGGSYQKPQNGAQSRQWTADRSLRRNDIGFRVAFDLK